MLQSSINYTATQQYVMTPIDSVDLLEVLLESLACPFLVGAGQFNVEGASP